jgi:hypothetical protein
MTQEIRYCPYCGKPLTNDGDFCAYCGKRIKTETPPSPPILSETPPPVLPVPPTPPPPVYGTYTPKQSSNKGCWIAALAAAGIIILLLIIILITNGSSQPEDTYETEAPEATEIVWPTDTEIPLPTATQEVPTESLDNFFATESQPEDLTQYIYIDYSTVTCQPDIIGYTNIEGTLTNTGPYPLTGIQLIGRVLDQNDNVLSIGSGVPDFITIQPNNSSYFKIPINGVFNDYHCTLEVRSAYTN